jgi:hypothetical protein
MSGSNGFIAGFGTGGAGCDKCGGSGSNGEAGNFINKEKWGSKGGFIFSAGGGGLGSAEFGGDGKIIVNSNKPQKEKNMSRSQTITVYLPSDREWLMRQLEIVVADQKKSISGFMLDALESALKQHGITKETTCP